MTESVIAASLEATSERLARWKRDHVEVRDLVYPTEDVAALVLATYRRILERDTRMNEQACTEDGFDLDAATAQTRADLDMVHALATRALELCAELSAAGYQNLAVDVARLREIRDEIPELLDDEPHYLDREDVRAALVHAETEYERGAWPRG